MEVESISIAVISTAELDLPLRLLTIMHTL